MGGWCGCSAVVVCIYGRHESAMIFGCTQAISFECVMSGRKPMNIKAKKTWNLQHVRLYCCKLHCGVTVYRCAGALSHPRKTIKSIAYVKIDMFERSAWACPPYTTQSTPRVLPTISSYIQTYKRETQHLIPWRHERDWCFIYIPIRENKKKNQRA